ncbi:MAG: carboxypeptidase regulatory-like domain-containing protein, partial [bacterium]|nr:carboxypeptidase regulatory-like domain-containing protein [bacterium]
MRVTTVIALVAALVLTAGAYAQVGDGSLRGYVRDESGAVLPGVNVTGTSEAIIGPRNSVTDGTGQYRIPNLPPGEYVLVFELPGFATYRQ